MADSNTVIMALKNALSVDVSGDNQVYTATCSFKSLKIYLNSANVQQLLIISGYTLTQFDDGFDIFYNNKSVGKLYGNNKRFQENEEEDFEFLFDIQDDELLDSDLISMDSALLSEIVEIKDCPHEIPNYENPNVDNVKVEYGKLPDMYNYVSKMDVDAALKHGKDYFESLRIRTESFIGDLEDHQYAQAKEMKENFDIFLKNISEKIEEGNEIWNEINELKEEWEEVQNIFDRMKETINEGKGKDNEAKILNTAKQSSPCWVSYDKFCTMLLPQMEEGDTCFEREDSNVISQAYESPYVKCYKETSLLNEKKRVWGFTGFYCFVNSTGNSVKFVPMKLRKDDKFLHSETINDRFQTKNENFQSNSSSYSSQHYYSNSLSSLLYEDLLHAILKSNLLFDKYLPKFQTCLNTKNLKNLYISILKEVVKNIQDEKIQKSLKMASSNPLISKMKLLEGDCIERESKPANRLRVEGIYISFIHPIKHYYKLEAMPQLKEKVDISTMIIEECAEKILMEYKKLDAELKILESGASDSYLVTHK